MTAVPHRSPRRIRGQRPAPGWLVIVVLIALAAGQWLRQPSDAPPAGDARVPPTANAPAEPSAAPESGEFEDVFVRRVVDGDTLLLQNGDRVRLQGVDTPETKKEGVPVQPWGPEAYEFTRSLVERKTVRLVFDRERFDQYQRLLAYVYVGDVFVNEELIRQGFSPAETQYAYRTDMKRRFQQAEQEARASRRGIWSATGR